MGRMQAGAGILGFLLLWLSVMAADAQTIRCPADRPEGDLVVAIREAEPFTYRKDSGDAAGFSVTLLTDVAAQLNHEAETTGGSGLGTVTFVDCGPIDVQETALLDGRIDMVISPLTITAKRMESYDFSQQYLSSGIALAVPYSSTIDFEEATGILLESVIQSNVLTALIGFLVFNLIMAFFVRWLLLTPRMVQVGPTRLWLFSVLETIIRTVGLRGVGDKFSSFGAKVLEVFLAVVGTALSATILGVLTSAFVGSVGAQPSVGERALAEMQIATLTCSTSQEVLLQSYRDLAAVRGEADPAYGALQQRIADLACVDSSDDHAVPDLDGVTGGVRLVDTWEQGVRLLADGQVHGVLGDWVALTYLSRQSYYDGKIEVLPNVYRNEPYGWAISRTTISEAVRRDIDRELIRRMRKADWRDTLEDTLGDGSVSPN